MVVVRLLQSAKEVSYSLTSIKTGTAGAITSSYFHCLVKIDCLEPVRFPW